jgi:signal peptidase I
MTVSDFADRSARVSAPSRWAAALLGLLATGLGHVYVGHLNRGLAWWSVILTFTFGTTWLGLWDRFSGLLVGLGDALAIHGASAIDAARIAVRRRRQGFVEPEPYQRWWVYCAYVLFSLMITPLFQGIVPLQTFAIPSENMVPTLAPGDEMVVRKVTGELEGVERGRVVVLRYEAGGTYVVSRILGLPGETIHLRGGVVHVDGAPIDDPWARGAASAASAGPSIWMERLENVDPVRIPDDAVFVMGDDRDRSLDSRMRGPVPVDAIHAFPLYVYWSSEDRDRIGRRVE